MSTSGATRRASRAWLLAGEALLWLLTLGCPLVLGGVRPEVLAATGLTGGLALAFVARGRGDKGVPTSAVALSLFLGALAASATVLPWPASLVAWLSPRAYALTTSLPRPPSGIRLTLDAPATVIDIPRLAGLAAIMLAAAALSRRIDQARRLAAAIGLAGVAVALVSGAHAALGLTELYGFYPVRTDVVISPLINLNQAASLALLGLLACLGLAQSAREPLPRIAWTLGAVACLVFGLETHSIGGIMAMVGATMLFLLLSARRTSQRTEGPSHLVRWTVLGGGLGLAGVLSIAAGLLGKEGLDQVLAHGFGKTRPWRPTLHLIRDFWLTGVGSGAYQAAYPPYAPPRTVATVTHPENIILQWLAEWGIPLAMVGFGLLAVTLWRAFRRLNDDDQLSPVLCALFAAVVGVLAHDLSDFGLEFAGVGVPFSVALGVLTGRAAGKGRWNRVSWLVAATAVVSASVSFAWGCPHLLRRQLNGMAGQEKKLDAAALDRRYQAIERLHPADPMVPIFASDALLARSSMRRLSVAERSRAMKRALRYLVRAQLLSHQEQPHLALAWALARLGHRSQAFTELRLAFAVGVNFDAIKQALANGASPEELASFPQALAASRAAAPDENVNFAPAHVSAVLLGYLAGTAGGPKLADETAQQILALPPGVAHTPELLDAVCRVEFMDGDGGRNGVRGCVERSRVSAVAMRLLTTGREWLQRYPSDPRGYACLSSGYMLLGADEQVRRVLYEALRKFPGALSIQIPLVQWALAQHHAREALAVLDQISGDGNDTMASVVRGLRVSALWAAGREAEAKIEAESAPRMYPGSGWAWLMAASMHEQDGEFDRALRDLSRARETGEDGAQIEAQVKRIQARQRALKRSTVQSGPP